MTPRELRRLGLALVRVLADSERTGEIHVAEELTGRGHFDNLRQTLFDNDEGYALLQDRPELCSDQVDYDALRRLPTDTLGLAYVDHLDRNRLSADSQAAPTRYIDDPEIAYLMRRFRQTHDVWHALVGLGTHGHEEVLLHAFSWGQLRLPVSAMVVLFGGLKHLVLEARWGTLRRGLPEAHAAGRAASPLLPVYWERHWSEPIAEVRERLRIAPCTPDFVEA
ncbi:MAG: Coq4 family protein [Myxococcota bacterium]